MRENNGATGIISLANRSWSDKWQVEANLMSRLATHHRVVWVEPAHHWRAALRRLSAGPTFLNPSEAESLTVYRPPAWLPAVHRPDWLRRLLVKARLRSVRRHLLACGCTRIVLYSWRPRFAEAAGMLPHDAVVYHVVDEYSFSDDDPAIPPAERRLLEEADQVIVHSPELMKKKGRVNPRTSLIPNGVNFDWFALPCPEPADLREVPRPRIGYSGYVKRQLDWELIETLVDRHPEFSWVFVGERSPHAELGAILERIGRRPNVWFLGPKSTRELARYPQHFDVCLMPYRVDGYTKFIFPLKLHEYLASGTPVVGSPIRTLLDFGHVIALAESPDEWSAAIQESLSPEQASDERRSERRKVARAYDWAGLTERVAVVVGQALRRHDPVEPGKRRQS